MNSTNKMTFIVSQFQAHGSNILDSQLYPKAKLLTELGWDCQFIGTDIPENCTRENLELLKIRYAFSDVHVLPLYPETGGYTAFSSMLKFLKPEVFRLLKKRKPAWVYFRNLFEFEAFNGEVKNIGGKCIYDVRAALSNEVRFKNQGIKGRVKEFFLLHKEKHVFREADYLLCVSEKMSDWIESISRRSDAFVIPCCADHEQFFPDENVKLKLRAELGWDIDAPVITYVGGASFWQRPEDIVRLFGELKSRVPCLKVLLLTGNVDIYTKMFQKIGFYNDDLYINKVHHSEVPNWMNIADVGIILRHDVLLNNVASPIKIGEYLSTGLAVVCTEGIGDFSKIILQKNAGIILGRDFSFDELVAFITDSKRLVECKKNALSLSRLFSRSTERELLSDFLSHM